MVELFAFIFAWILFYYILTYRKKRAPAIKATIIALLFTGLFYSIMTKVYTRFENKLPHPTTSTHKIPAVKETAPQPAPARDDSQPKSNLNSH